MASSQQPQQLTPQQMAQMQQQFAAEAAKHGLSPQQFAEKLRQQHAQQQQQQQQQQQGGQQEQAGPQHQQAAQVQGQNGQQVPIQPGPPKPEAIAVAKFLKSQDLKSRPCILQEKRKELFKVKRAIRALQSPAYAKARAKKNSLLPEVTDRASAEQAFKLLPMSMLALRVSKFDPSENPPHGHPGHVHGADESAAPKKKKKGELPVMKIEQQQDAADPHHYVWFYEGAQWAQKAYAALALVAILAIVLFPLWPYTLRRGVWYVSMAALGLLGAFFGLAIVRLILFLVTLAVAQPGIWLYPNLFEDVGFFDSFRPVWAWRETKESLAAKKAAKKAKRRQKKLGKPAKEEASNGGVAAVAVGGEAGATGVEGGGAVQRRNLSARVEEVEDDEE